MHQPTDGGQCFIAGSRKILPHSPKRLICSDHDRAPLVTCGDQFEQNAGFGLVLGDVRQIIEAQRVVLSASVASVCAAGTLPDPPAR